jgi:hypothetical protein
MSIWGETKMHEAYCLTALEAAEMAGIELSELMRIAANQSGIAVKVGDTWRVDPTALAQLTRQDDMRNAA